MDNILFKCSTAAIKQIAGLSQEFESVSCILLFEETQIKLIFQNAVNILSISILGELSSKEKLSEYKIKDVEHFMKCIKKYTLKKSILTLSIKEESGAIKLTFSSDKIEESEGVFVELNSGNYENDFNKKKEYCGAMSLDLLMSYIQLIKKKTKSMPMSNTSMQSSTLPILHQTILHVVEQNETEQLFMSNIGLSSISQIAIQASSVSLQKNMHAYIVEDKNFIHIKKMFAKIKDENVDINWYPANRIGWRSGHIEVIVPYKVIENKQLGKLDIAPKPNDFQISDGSNLTSIISDAKKSEVENRDLVIGYSKSLNHFAFKSYREITAEDELEETIYYPYNTLIEAMNNFGAHYKVRCCEDKCCVISNDSNWVLKIAPIFFNKEKVSKTADKINDDKK